MSRPKVEVILKAYIATGTFINSIKLIPFFSKYSFVPFVSETLALLLEFRFVNFLKEFLY